LVLFVAFHRGRAAIRLTFTSPARSNWPRGRLHPGSTRSWGVFITAARTDSSDAAGDHLITIARGWLAITLASTPARRLIWRNAKGGRGGRQVKPTWQRCRGLDQPVFHLCEKTIGNSGIHARHRKPGGKQVAGVEVGVSTDACRLSPLRMTISRIGERLIGNSGIHAHPDS
jgi:hypothetical protein